MDSDDFIQLAENKYNRLLTILLLLLVSMALPENYGIAKVIGLVLFSIAILLIVRQIKPGRRLIKFYTLLVVIHLLLLLFLTLQLLGWFTIPPFINGEFAINSILFIVTSLPIVLIQKEIFLIRKVTADTLKGGIAIYLLLGLSWAVFYDSVYTLNPSAFDGISPSQYQADFLHFSFTTLTTVGYGDITPVTAFARIAANLQAIVGVMYPSILIARLVSLYNTSS